MSDIGFLHCGIAFKRSGITWWWCTLAWCKCFQFISLAWA